MDMHTRDLIFSCHGSIWLMRHGTLAGEAWIDEHIDHDAIRYAGSVVVEPRYVDDIVNGARGDGLVVGSDR